MLIRRRTSYSNLFSDTVLILILTVGMGIYWSITLLFSPRLLPLITEFPGLISVSDFVDHVFTRPSLYESGKK
jgi:hypothetical protein